MATRPGRTAWKGSNRKSRLPADWDTVVRPAVELRNPKHICHECGQPGGSDLDHKQRGDHNCQQPGAHAQPCYCNLDWIHGRKDYLAGVSLKNCHGEKSAREGAAAVAALNAQRRPEEEHPAFA